MPADTFCTLWELTPKVGAVLRVCNFERDIVYGGQTYTALPLDAADVQMASGLSPDDSEMTIPALEPFTPTKLRGGYWRGARVVIRVVDWSDLNAAAVRTHVGSIGEIGYTNLTVTPQYRSQSQLLNQPVGSHYAETCPHILGDGGCKKDLTTFTYTGTVTAVTDSQQFSVSVVQADGWFSRGKITFTGGANAGLSEEIQQNTGAALILFKPMAGVVAVGNGVTLIAGDDKTIQTCIDKFDNAINFGGFPHLPGRTRVFSFPD